MTDKEISKFVTEFKHLMSVGKRAQLVMKCEYGRARVNLEVIFGPAGDAGHPQEESPHCQARVAGPARHRRRERRARGRQEAAAQAQHVPPPPPRHGGESSQHNLASPPPHHEVPPHNGSGCQQVEAAHHHPPPLTVEEAAHHHPPPLTVEEAAHHHHPPHQVEVAAHHLPQHRAEEVAHHHPQHTVEEATHHHLPQLIEEVAHHHPPFTAEEAALNQPPNPAGRAAKSFPPLSYIPKEVFPPASAPLQVSPVWLAHYHQEDDYYLPQVGPALPRADHPADNLPHKAGNPADPLHTPVQLRSDILYTHPTTPSYSAVAQISLKTPVRPPYLPHSPAGWGAVDPTRAESNSDSEEVEDEDKYVFGDILQKPD